MPMGLSVFGVLVERVDEVNFASVNGLQVARVKNFLRRAVVDYPFVVKADDPLGVTIDDIQVVRNEKNRHFTPFVKIVQKIIDGFLAGDVNAFGRFVKNQDIGIADNRPSDDNALGLPAGKGADRSSGNFRRQTDEPESGGNVRRFRVGAQAQKFTDGKRQGFFQNEFLGNVADFYVFLPGKRSPSRLKKSHQRFDEHRFAAPFGPIIAAISLFNAEGNIVEHFGFFNFNAQIFTSEFSPWLPTDIE